MMATEAPPVAPAPEVTEGPVFEMIDPNVSLRTCDGHANGAVNALVSILLPSGGLLEMCGNCARKNFGFEFTNFVDKETKLIGSDH